MIRVTDAKPLPYLKGRVQVIAVRYYYIGNSCDKWGRFSDKWLHPIQTHVCEQAEATSAFFDVSGDQRHLVIT